MFLLCVLCVASIRAIEPFSSLSPAVGFPATLALYAVLAVLTARSYRRRKNYGLGGANHGLSSWPYQHSSHKYLALALLLISGVLGLAAYLVQSPSAEITLTALALGAMGIWMLLVPVYALRFGYFPSTSKGKGIDRLDDPPQFWATVVVFSLFGGAVLSIAVRLQIGNL